MLKLFVELTLGSLFHFGDKPDRILIKSNGSHYVSPEGRRNINPFVAIFQHKPNLEVGGKSIYDQFQEGKDDGIGPKD